MRAHVVAFTTSESKFEEAKRLGADEVVLSKDVEQMAAYRGKLHSKQYSGKLALKQLNGWCGVFSRLGLIFYKRQNQC